MERFKKFLQGFFSAVLVVGLMPSFAYAAPVQEEPLKTRDIVTLDMSGTGTDDDPYLITSAADFEELVDNVETYGWIDESYRLETDVTLDSLDSPIGDVSDADYVFAGVFDGNGHSITMDATYSDKESGLFASLNGATVKNLVIKGSVTSTFTGASASTGALAGTCSGNTVIENVVNEAAVTSQAGATNLASVGGLVGSDTVSGSTLTISNSANKGNVGFSAAAGTGKHRAGGLVGCSEASSTSISSSSNTGNISNANYAGGILGSGYAYSGRTITIENCYNAGTIPASTGSVYSGGILGATSVDSSVNKSRESITDCCVLEGTQISAKPDYVTLTNARAVTSDALKANPSVLGEAFIADAAGGYPVLVSQIAPVDAATQVDVRYKSSDESMGTLSCGGERVTVGAGAPKGSTATASSGYRFVKWIDATGAAVSQNAAFVPTVTTNAQGSVAYTAVFEEDAAAVRTATFKVNQENAVITVTPVGSESQAVTVTSSGNAADANGYWAWTAELDPSLSYNVTVTCEGAKEDKTDTISAGTDAVERSYDLELSVQGDPRLAAMSLNGVNVEFEDNTNYPWSVNGENEDGIAGGLKSTNQSVNTSHSTTTITISSEKEFSLSFDHASNSESNYDYLTITLDGAQIANDKVSGQNGQLRTGRYSNDALAAGTHVLVLDFVKDNSGNQGTDTSYVYNIVAEVNCEHSNKTRLETVPPTCTEEGYTLYDCNDCGKKGIRLDPVDALGHDESVNVTLAATCEADGSKTTTCKRAGCDYSVTEVIPATGHDWDWEHATALDDKGNVEASCLNGCGKKRQRNIYISEWEGDTEIWSAGNGAEDNPYIIDSAASLAYLAQQVKEGNSYSGSHFRLDMDLDLKNLEWTPIGVYVMSGYSSGSDKPFSGVFDGNGHTISNLNVTSSEGNSSISIGLFGLVNNAAIKNLTVASGSVRYTGASLVAAGGIVGACKGTNAIENCFNAASVIDGANSGGIVGKVNSGATLTMEKCGNSGDVTTVKSSSYAGGLIGNIVGSYVSPASVTIQHSRNTATNISATNSSSNGGGGLVGAVEAAGLTCKASYSSSSVSAGYAGGMIGRMTTNYMQGLHLENCFAAGDVNGLSSTGGIMGYVNGYMLTEDKASIKNCIYPQASNGVLAGKEFAFDNCFEYDASHCNSSEGVQVLNTGLEQQDVDGTPTPVFSVGVTAPVLYWELDTLPEPATQRAATFAVSPVGATLALTDVTANKTVAVVKDASASNADVDVWKATLDPTHDYSLTVSKQYFMEQTATIPASPYQSSYQGSFTLSSLFDSEVVVGNEAGASSSSSSQYYAPYRPGAKNVFMEQIYTASEIGLDSDASIKELAFNVDVPSELDADLKIYLGHTDAASTGTSSTISFVEPTDLKLVYDGPITLGKEKGWENIGFDNPFEYDHTKNLAVIVVRSSANSNTALRYKTESNTTRMVWGKYSDTVEYTDYETAKSATVGTNQSTELTSYYAQNRPIARFGLNSCAHEGLTADDTRTVAPTCTERGYTATICPVCNCIVSKTYDADPLGHVLHEEITLAPTCEAEGVKTITCTRSGCGYVTTEDVSATGHDWDWEHATILDDKGNVEASCLNGCGKTMVKNLFVDEWDGTAVEWESGDGTEANPYMINTAENLAYLAQQVNSGQAYSGKCFELATDLDLMDLPWTPIGNNNTSSSVFCGTFDGGGHAVANMNITYTSRTEGTGLFGAVSAATIKNLRIVSGSVNIGGTSGYVAGLVGKVCASGTDVTIISRCSNAADVTAYQPAGIVGYNASPVVIEHCANSGDISSSSTYTYAGGILANQYHPVEITGCYSTGNVSATGSGSYAGGLIGKSHSGNKMAVKNSFSTAMPTGTNAGGLIGSVGSAANTTFENCYWAGSENSYRGNTTTPSTFTACAGLDDFMTEDAIEKLNAGLDKVDHNGEEMDVFSTFEEGDIDHPILFWEPRVPIEITVASDSIAFVIDEADPGSMEAQAFAIDYNGANELDIEVVDESVVTATLATNDEGDVVMNVTPTGVGITTITISDGKRACQIDVTVAKVAVKGGSLRMDNTGSADASMTSMRMGFEIELPHGMDASNLSWRWNYGIDGEVDESLTCEGVNYLMDGDTLVTNIVFTGINDLNYATELAAQLQYTMTFTDAQGQEQTMTATQPVQTRSVLNVADSIMASDSASQAEKDYATGILRQASVARP